MSIIEKFFGVVTDRILTPKAENATTAFIDSNFVDKSLEESIVTELLETYGTEPFYNDFDGYITKNNVIKNVIASIRGTGCLQPNSRTKFVRENEKCFLSQYPKYRQKPVQHSQVCRIFEKIFDAVSLKVNTLNPHSEIGKLQNTKHQF